MPESCLRIVLADDAAVVRRGLRDLLAEHARLQIVGEAADAPQAIAVVQRLLPDALVLDFRMPGGGALAVLAALRQLVAAPTVIVLTNYADATYRARCRAAGARFFLDKSSQFHVVPDLLQRLRSDPWLNTVHPCQPTLEN